LLKPRSTRKLLI